jgi:hypothetical protein
MRLLKIIFSSLWYVGFLGNVILFLYIEFSFLRQSFIQFFNPLILHPKVLGVLLSTPLFWVFLAMAVVGYYAASSIERYPEQGTKRTKVNADKVVPPSPQEIEERQTSPLVVPPQPLPQLANEPVGTEPVEPKIELLEWAIQSSQKVRFSYEKSGEKSDRMVTPLNLKIIGPTLFLECYCHIDCHKRTFEVGCIWDIKIVSVGEKNSAQSSPPDVRMPINIQSGVISPSQSSTSDVPKTEYTGARIKKRLCIKYSTEELEKIADSKWNNAKVLSEIHYELEFRSRKKALDLRERITTRLIQLQDTQFPWPTNIVNPGSRNISSDVFMPGEGILRQYGYKVGMNGLSENERWEILDTVFLRPLLQKDNAAYLGEWGEPNSAERLQKLVKSIAAFTRNAKRRNKGSFNKAIQDWETDLAYLKRTYYNNRFSFQYPRT